MIPGGDTKVFEVTIKVFGYDKDLKPAMTTSNIISSTTLQDVIYIPLEAVFHNDSLAYVIRKKEPSERQIIEPGAENGNYVVVKQGLSEDEEILMHEPYVEDEEDIKFIGLDIYESLKDSSTIVEKKTLSASNP